MLNADVKSPQLSVLKNKQDGNRQADRQSDYYLIIIFSLKH